MSTQIKTPFFVALGTAALMSVSTLSFAGDNPSYSELDSNSDGTISKQEAQSNDKLAKQFDEVDTDSDGVLGWSEFARFESEGKVDDANPMDKSNSRAVPEGNNSGLQPDGGMTQ